MLTELAAAIPQVQNILTAVNAITAAVTAVKATTPAAKKAVADAQAKLDTIKAHVSDLHLMVVGKRP